MKLIFSALLLLPIGIPGFSPSNHQALVQTQARAPTFQLYSQRNNEHASDQQQQIKNAVMSSLIPLALSGLLALAPPAAIADDGAAEISACRKNPAGATNCVSTRNVKQLDLYAPPWTFETTPEEAAARIKGVVASDSALEMVQEKDNLYFQIKASRTIFSDSVQVLINPSDKVVTFRAEQEGEPIASDFGAIRKELESIRQKSQFGVMGQAMGAADTMPSQNGPIGQLKAFYGLQSGQGYEDVFAR